MTWSQNAIEQLGKGERAQVCPRGHSMSGRIQNGELVTLAPIMPAQVRAGDIVLAHVRGKRRELVVLHEVLETRESQFLIGACNGRVDGWVEGAALLGRLVETES